ncbi:hypothetical protein [Nonomuraea bangladeshensis]|uniref:hypothetical protein n=1 Tax=Nonomuraea bangladeshensis TaxID=404385 RepID=UPI0031D241EE
MSRDTTAASAARTNRRASRKEQTEQLRHAGVTDPVLIGDRLGVHSRTIQRYLRELEGDVDRRGTVYPELKPMVLQHLRTYPHLRITAWMLARVLGLPGTAQQTVKKALRSLERDGLVRHEIGARGTTRDLNDCTKVILWSLAEQEQPDER